MNTLIILRHAKAVHVPGMADHDRPLTGRGERDARQAGVVLGDLGLAPDLVLCSPAMRTRQTAELALAAFASGAPVDYEGDIYLAYPDDLLGLIRRTDDDVSTLLLVGHNPGVHELALSLTGDEGGPGFSPGAFAVVETEGAWADLWPGEARALARWSPKAH